MKKASPKAILRGRIPFDAMCFSVSFWVHVYPMVFGKPFTCFWPISWTVLSSVLSGAV